jgi:hypothetical protein
MSSILSNPPKHRRPGRSPCNGSPVIYSIQETILRTVFE